MKITITPCVGGYSLAVYKNRTFNPQKILSEVAPHLTWIGKPEDVYLEEKFQLELVSSEIINPYVKTNGELNSNAASIILALSLYAELPKELAAAQILSIGQCVRSSENGLGYLSLMNGGIKFSPLNAERKYKEKPLYAVTCESIGAVFVSPSFINADFYNNPGSG